MEKSKIIKYAELIAKVGANIQKGQEVNLVADIEIKDFILILIEECYKAGASKVNIDWTDDELTKLNIKYADEEKLSHLTSYEKAKQGYNIENHPVRIYIESSDPDGLKDLDQEKYGRILASKGKEIREYRDKYDDYCQWVIAGVPGLKWAKKVFPNDSDEVAKEKLFELILKVSRAFDGDPIKNWEIHNANLVEKANKLNNLKLHYLHYTSKNGTNLTVELLNNVKWEAGGEYTKGTKIYFQPNIPTEECFTSPNKFGTNGVVYSTKPLSYRGQIIEDFSLTFKDGKVIEAHAKKGEDLLKNMLKLDENAAYLGECALVPFHSPINDTKTLFFSTLYDENASCHLALGTAFPMLIENYENMSEDEIKKVNINKSIVHTDFMIGTDDLKIEGIDFDGNKVTIFENGDWSKSF